VTRVGVGMLSGCWLGSGDFGGVGVLCCGVMWICRLAKMRNFARRLSCLLSELVRGVCSLLGYIWVLGCAMGQIV